MNKALEFYENEISKSKDKIKDLNKIINIISIIRLGIVLAAIGAGYYFFKIENIILLIVSILVGLLAFIIAAIFHNKKIRDRKEAELFISINNRGINRINGNFKNVEDKGEEFLDEKHPFSSDLDVFGRNSLFQMINSTKTKFGREKLSKILSLKEIPTKEEIIKRQEAIKELGEKVKWRQELEVKSTLKKSGLKDIDKLLEWANSKREIKPLFKIVPYLFIALTIISIVLVTFSILPVTYLILVFMINYLVVKVLTKELAEVISLFDNHKKDIEAYTNLLSLMYEEEFSSELLKELKEKLIDGDKNAVKEMKALKSLVDWIGDSTGNAYYLLLNVTMLSDTLF